MISYPNRLPVVKEVRFVGTEMRDGTHRIHVYDSSKMVYEKFGDDPLTLHRDAIVWVVENYTVPDHYTVYTRRGEEPWPTL